MKGKGKGKDIPDSKDCPLQFPDFTPIDHIRHCPRYSTVLQRNDEELVGIEDLDALQLEMETLLVSVTKRRHQLEQEMQILVTWQDKKEKKTSGKQVTVIYCYLYYNNANVLIHVIILKIFQAKLQEYEFTDSPLEVPRMPKNDAPNRFWASIEPYCAEITQDDIKVLEDLIKSHDDDADYYKIPALGKHYSLKWAQEDLLEEQKEGAKINERRRGLSNNSSLNSSEPEKLLKKVEKEYENDDTSSFGALTQRLVSCLIEENLMTSLEDSMNDTLAKDNSDGNASPPPIKGNIMKSFNMGNTMQLEKRIRRELEEQGILDADDVTVENPDDEILTELKKCQAELKTLSTYNLTQIKRLLRLAKEEMAKQEIRKKLQVADNEVMEAHRRIMASKQKKRSPTKKEKELAMKAIKEREQILKQLDGIGQFV
ncbi:transcriptional adapter 3-B-like [Centruroides sculpturatus]|uniref:transcriptional adapter 3-B-like n=1 Tax=Centruroides sculpturatus TaxID=218467 RepID=UPI000C6EAB66|nr:transcriptional adapter 3-B-like [Centruroides sculpturatus]